MSGRRKPYTLERQLLVLVPLALTAFGLVMVYSATSAPAALGNGNPTAYLERQAIYAFLGFGLMIVAARSDYHKLRALAPGLVVTALVLCVAVLGIGERINGARRWIGFGPAAFQPSELAKLAVVIWCASYLARKPAPRSLKDLGRPVGMLVGLFCLLVLLEPDLGTVITIVVMVGAMLLVAGTPLPTLGGAYGIVFGLAALASWLSPYRRARLLVFLNPWKDPTNNGLQNVQALISLGSGGVFGKGLGNGVAEEPLPAGGAHRHDLRRHRRGAWAHRRLARDRRVLRRRLRGSPPRAHLQGSRSANGSPPASPRSSPARRRSTSRPCSVSPR